MVQHVIGVHRWIYCLNFSFKGADLNELSHVYFDLDFHVLAAAQRDIALLRAHLHVTWSFACHMIIYMSHGHATCFQFLFVASF